MTQNELNEIITLHLKWLGNEKGGERADLSNANLIDADLSNDNLIDADFSNANLYNADLYNANLSNANLRNTDLSNANLCNANLRNTDLSNADLYNTDFSNADLYNANLRNVDLSNANLSNAKSILSFIGEKHLLIYFKHENIYYFKIGCITFPVDHWLDNFKSIGNKENYSIEQVKLYGDIIKLFSQYDLLGE